MMYYYRFSRAISFLTGVICLILGLINPTAIQPAQASGLTITVTSTSDTIAGTCPDVAICTLRAAITMANANAGSTINFSVPIRSIITLSSALPALAADVTITGLGADQLTVSGASNYQVLAINSGVTVDLSNITIAYGYASAGIGYDGGGIENNGTLSIDSSTFSSNYAVLNGGGIYNNGTVSISNSTFIGNDAPRTGGGIYNNGTVSISNSTFSSNFALDRGGGSGGAIANSGTLSIDGSTFSSGQIR